MGGGGGGGGGGGAYFITCQCFSFMHETQTSVHNHIVYVLNNKLISEKMHIWFISNGKNSLEVIAKFSQL